MSRIIIEVPVVLVVGDVMLDQFVWGNVERISPEAPVPVVNVVEDSFVPGGASNVARNVVSLGGRCVVVGITGKDYHGRLLKKLLDESGIETRYMLEDEEFRTIIKTRIISRGQQLLRIDREISISDHRITVQIIKTLSNLKENCLVNVIAVSDYNKGVITEEVMDFLHRWRKESGIPLIIDPKPANKKLYKGAYMCTPNLKEAEAMSGVKIVDQSSLIEAGRQILDSLMFDALLITQGEDGMTLFEGSKAPYHIDACAKEVFDITGAGDTVVATVAFLIGKGYNLRDACVIANKAAGIVVGKVGTAVVDRKELGVL